LASFPDECSRDDRAPVKRRVTASTAIQVGYHKLGQCSSHLRSVTCGLIVISSNNFQIADSALEDRQVQVSCTAPISAIRVRSPSYGSEGCDGPADRRLLARLARRFRLRRVRDEEAAGSNPATPTGNRQVTEHIVTCPLHYTFPGVRFWEPVGSGQRIAQGFHGPPGPPGCYNFPYGFKGLLRRAGRSGPGRFRAYDRETLLEFVRRPEVHCQELWVSDGAARRLRGGGAPHPQAGGTGRNGPAAPRPHG
jgi:hypothetical protein